MEMETRLGANIAVINYPPERSERTEEVKSEKKWPKYNQNTSRRVFRRRRISVSGPQVPLRLEFLGLLSHIKVRSAFKRDHLSRSQVQNGKA